MTFAEVLPLLQAGRKVRQHSGGWNSAVYLLRDGVLGFECDSPPPRDWCKSQSADLLASDWELADEPASTEKPVCDCCSDLFKQVTRLTRELAEERQHYERLQRWIRERP